MAKYLKRELDTVFILLDNKKKIKTDFLDFLCEAAYENTDHKLILRFCCDELFSHFEDIKTIVNTLNKRNGITFYYELLTNEKLISNEMIGFFNKNDIGVVIDWSEKSTLKAKEIDIFDNTNQQKRILKVKKLKLSGIISTKSYPKEMLDTLRKIDHAYFHIHDYHIGIILDKIFNIETYDKKLLDLDLKQVSSEIEEIISSYINSDIKTQDYISRSYIENFIKKIKKFYFRKNKSENYNTIIYWDNYNTLNIDTEGNLYLHYNIDNPVGHISSSFTEYLNGILKIKQTELIKEECKNCIAQFICKNERKINENEEMITEYCNLKKVIAHTLIDNLQKFNKKAVDQS